MAYLLCVSADESSSYKDERMSCHTGGRDKISAQCELSYDFSSFVTRRRTLYTWSRSKESSHCVSSGDSSGAETE